MNASKSLQRIKSYNHICGGYHGSLNSINNKFKELEPVLNLLGICLTIEDTKYGNKDNFLHIELE